MSGERIIQRMFGATRFSLLSFCPFVFLSFCLFVRTEKKHYIQKLNFFLKLGLCKEGAAYQSRGSIAGCNGAVITEGTFGIRRKPE